MYVLCTGRNQSRAYLSATRYVPDIEVDTKNEYDEVNDTSNESSFNPDYSVTTHEDILIVENEENNENIEEEMIMKNHLLIIIDFHQLCSWPWQNHALFI